MDHVDLKLPFQKAPVVIRAGTRLPAHKNSYTATEKAFGVATATLTIHMLHTYMI